MSRRKFSFDLPRLKIGTFKPEPVPQWNLPHAMPMEPESPGEIPKTVRPLPSDLDAALRAACTNVVRNNKPSHEYHKGGKAQLDYATIRRGGGNQPALAPAPRKTENPSAALSKADTNEDHRQAQRESLSTGVTSPDKSQRMSHISSSANVHSPTQESSQTTGVQRSRAQSRADQLMGGASPPKAQTRVDELMGSPPKLPVLHRDRTNSHSRSQSTPQPFWTAPPPIAERPKPAPRAHSMETTGSTPQKEPATHQWPAESPVASASNLPARSTSLRNPVNKALRSGAEARNAMNVDAYDAEWMREESEKRRLLQQQAYAEAIASRHATWTGPKPELRQEEEDNSEKGPENGSQTTTPIITVPARKPVPTAQSQAEISQDSDINPEPEVKSEFDEPSSPELDLSLTDPALLDGRNSKHEERAPSPQRSRSRMGRGRTRGTGVPMNSRAASRARSITREVKEFMRNASRSRQPRAKGDEPQGRSRRPSLSRTRDAVVDYFRPGTAMGGNKQSLDIPRNAADLKSKSHESLVSARSTTSAAKDTPMQQNSQRSSQHNQTTSIHTGPLSRNSSDGGDGDAEPRGNLSVSEVPQRKSQVDLNRALPPLPRLESWHDDGAKTPDTPPEPPKHACDPPRSPQSALPSPGLASTIALQQDPSRSSGRSPLPSPGLASTIAMQSNHRHSVKSPLPSPKLPDGVHDFVALRMGAPVEVSRQSSRAKMSREHMNPNLVHQTRSARAKRGPADPRQPNLQAADTRAALTTPSSINLAKRGESQTSRRRSKSVQEVNAPDLSAKLRQASANAPDGRAVHAVGHAKLINTTPTRKESDNLATKLGRKLSTRTKRNITPTANEQPPVPPPHRELPQQRSKHSSHSPPGFSHNDTQTPSSHRTSLSRKMSMEEYGRMYDGRYNRQADTLTTPPPAAAANPKSSPLMGLGNFLPSKHQQQSQQHANGSKKWWHLGLSKEGEKDHQPMDQVSRGGGNTDGGLGVRF